MKTWKSTSWQVQFSSVNSVMSNSLRTHGLQHAMPPCPSPTPGVYPNSCALSWWCHPAISSSVVPFSSCLQSFPASVSFPMSQFHPLGGQSIGFSFNITSWQSTHYLSTPCLKYVLSFFFFFFFLSFLILFLNFTILYWFCQTSKWIRHRYTRVPHPEPSSLLPPHTVPLGHPSAPAPSIRYHASNLDWWLIPYMILYVFQCHSPKSSHPLPLPQRPKDCSIHQCLFCCLVYRVLLPSF